MRKARLTFALLGSAALALAACSGTAVPGGADAATTAGPTDDTASETVAGEAAIAAPAGLPGALENADGLQTVAEALKATGMAGATFNGKASYTLLAPEDAAFVALGDTGKALFTSADHTALSALIRSHLLPGRITPQDLTAAIDAQPDGRFAITTLGGSVLTFTRSSDGTAIRVTAPDGSQAVLDGEPVPGGSSIAIPITGLLAKVAAPA